jgi:hypothetical protein
MFVRLAGERAFAGDVAARLVPRPEEAERVADCVGRRSGVGEREGEREGDCKELSTCKTL